MFYNVLRRQIVMLLIALFVVVLTVSVSRCAAGDLKVAPGVQGAVKKVETGRTPVIPLPKASFESWTADNTNFGYPNQFAATFTIVGKNLTTAGTTFVVKTDKGETCFVNVLSDTEAKGTIHFPQNKTYNTIHRKCKLYLNDTAVGAEIAISQAGLPK